MGETLKKNVDELLKLKGWTRYRLSKESGVSMTVIYNLAQKESGPSADTLIKISNALGCTVDALVRPCSRK
ncbi:MULTISPECIES: helix-turn-helix transcriptional regulator [unclassified Paenibacillus]|uniref:helix-turn-helix transcriptional regulator n=1 Tax=unclassified Paenibacillus TaxID=185978 RepID=UPI002406CEF8|nr:MULTISPECIES: helix-turn-helix transcriptional regulator [unclassified Paenibacillus]MDF9844588.1 transcriptional regulator with XRE-family HTH domain [Paenibacillus sp. PastF-2]MDF9851234.1 transcriptional regulator with XRE-family HTH domain [Paenibacillus sp. PastM-2]MDF9857773.1 transcriptional regulator with XRE-family HTH domain [Paenibacillus sp. PastF-1]MDH6483083.1 transcriptional regulator with XRE-family HTH domain [Paenibacillus sp. PastH-2]MDH6510453.1 transcriptional regulator